MEVNRNCGRSGQNRYYYNQGTTVRYTGASRQSQQGTDGTQSSASGTGSQPIGMAYIPEQTFENLYDAKSSLMEGTMFKDLNLIFCGVRGK